MAISSPPRPRGSAVPRRHRTLVTALVLAWKAPYAPTILGALLVAAGLVDAVDAFGSVLFADYQANVAAFTFLGELVLIVWLLVKGRRLAVA